VGYEVDFLPVGSGEKSGDAIALRFGDLDGPRDRQMVVVIDGGTVESGGDLARHVRTHYRTDVVDLVVNTHPDGDHASGLEVVLAELRVRRLWMHLPWDHSADIRNMFRDGRLTNDGLSAKMQKALGDASDLARIARRKNIPITEPFADGEANFQYPAVRVLGPTRSYYQGLLTDFRDMPETHEAVEYYSRGGAATALLEAIKAAVSRVAESWGVETLSDPAEDATSAENNSSAILLFRIDGRDLLFTGDAGVSALERAAYWAEASGIDLKRCSLTQIPHHGSKRNVGPTILNRIVGPRLPGRTGISTKTAIVSAAAEGAPKHPAKKVTNAYIRRGAKVLATQGDAIRHHFEAPPRQGWVVATPVPFYDQVEE
jgi:beta-lactamase superfamily II metal-dependent hydrolase